MGEPPESRRFEGDLGAEEAEHAGLAVSVIIPHYQDFANLDRCLELLERQTLDRALFEIVVADNASPAGLDEVRRVVGNRAQVVLSKEKGAGITRNVGVAASSGRVLAFVDSDCRPTSEFLVEGMNALKSYQIVGGSVRVEVAEPKNPTPCEAFELVFAFRNDHYIRVKKFSVTAALFVTREVFVAVGPFRNDMSEDLEWGNRATAMGYSLGFARDAVIGHPARRSWDELERKWRRLTDEGFGVARHRRFGRLRWLVRNWAAFASTAPHLVRILLTDRLEAPSHRLAAMGVLVRLRTMRFLWAHSVLRHGTVRDGR